MKNLSFSTSTTAYLGKWYKTGSKLLWSHKKV